MAEQPKLGGWGALIAAKLVCCAGLVLVASGAFGGIWASLFDGGLTWIVAGFGVAIVCILLWRRYTAARGKYKTLKIESE